MNSERYVERSAVRITNDDLFDKGGQPESIEPYMDRAEGDIYD